MFFLTMSCVFISLRAHIEKVLNYEKLPLASWSFPSSINLYILYFYFFCSTAPPKEAFSEMKEHKKIIEKGVPEDVPPGIKGSRVSYM